MAVPCHPHKSLSVLLPLDPTPFLPLSPSLPKRLLTKTNPMFRTIRLAPPNKQVPTPAKRDLSMVYVEAFRHSTIVIRMELWVGQAALEGDPEATAGKLGVVRLTHERLEEVVVPRMPFLSPTAVSF